MKAKEQLEGVKAWKQHIWSPYTNIAGEAIRLSVNHHPKGHCAWWKHEVLIP